MENMIDRIKEVFENSGESQTTIAKKTNVSPAYIWKIINGNIVKPRNLFISAVCQEFKVNENWLRTGEGEPYRKNIDWSELLKKLENNNDGFLKNMIEVYLDLDQSSKNVLKTVVEKLGDKQRKYELELKSKNETIIDLQSQLKKAKELKKENIALNNLVKSMEETQTKEKKE